jgi:tetratricopeptide (TPR) repeat protein
MAYNHYHRAWYLALFGRMNEAIEAHKRAQELDPFTPLHSAWLGALYGWVGLYDEAIKEADKVLETHTDYALSMYIKGIVLMKQGKTDSALEHLKKAASINSGWKYMGYGRALIRAGYLQEGREIIEELENLPTSSFGSLCLAYMYVELKDYNRAFEWFDKAKRHAFYPWIRVMIEDETFKEDPRYLDLIREMNLPDPAPLTFDPDLL